MAKINTFTSSTTTKEEKFKALEILRNNNFDLKKTSEELGINFETLKTWDRRYGRKVYTELDEEAYKDIKQITEEVEPVPKTKPKKKKEEKGDAFIIETKDAKMRALKRLQILIPREKNMARLANTLEILHKITSSEGIKDVEENKTVNNYLNMIKSQYNIVENGNEN